MSNELSMAELESELCAELPERSLMRRHKHFSRRHHFSARHGFSGAHASFGSAAASNSTTQVNFNPQIVINNGRVGGGVNLSSHNANFNTTNQNLVPINFGF